MNHSTYILDDAAAASPYSSNKYYCWCYLRYSVDLFKSINIVYTLLMSIIYTYWDFLFAATKELVVINWIA